MRYLNFRAWHDNLEPDEAPDLDALDDPEKEAEYWRTVDEAIDMVRDKVWQ